MNVMTIQELIAQGEHTNVELKSAHVRPETFAYTIITIAKMR